MNDQRTFGQTMSKHNYFNADGEIYEIINGELICPKELICPGCGKVTDALFGFEMECKECPKKHIEEREARPWSAL